MKASRSVGKSAAAALAMARNCGGDSRIGMGGLHRLAGIGHPRLGWRRHIASDDESPAPRPRSWGFSCSGRAILAHVRDTCQPPARARLIEGVLAATDKCLAQSN